MATLPSEAASDPAVAAGLLDAGMQIARINLAHDGPAEWAAMAAHVRSAASAAGAPCLISVDLAGPKLRVLFPPDELPRKEADDKATEVEPSVEGSTASSSTEEETKGAAKKPASAAAPPEVVRLRPEKDTLGRLMQAAPVVLLALGDAPPPPEWLAPPPRVAGGEVARPPPPAAACGACGGGPHGPPAALASAPRVPLQPPGGWRLCAAAGPGDGVALCDARGRRRRLAVTAAGPGWVAAEAPRGVYIVPGATLALHKAVGSSEIDDDDNDGPCGDAPLLGAAARAVVAPMPQPPPAPPQQPAAGCRRRRPGVRLVPGDALVVRLSGTAPEEAAAAEAMAAEAEGAPVVEVPCEELFAGVRCAQSAALRPSPVRRGRTRSRSSLTPYTHTIPLHPPHHLSPGHRILLDDGRFVCDVERTLPPGGRGFLLRVAAAAAPPGGKPLRLRPGRGLNAPDTPLDAPALGPADRAALADALASVRPDCVALSFVQSPKDVADLHAALDAAGADGVAVILKIETATARGVGSAKAVCVWAGAAKMRRPRPVHLR